MKSFEEWTEDLIPEKITWEKWENEGQGIMTEKGFEIQCCICEDYFYISDFIGPEEFDPDIDETFYCGGSPRCCP